MIDTKPSLLDDFASFVIPLTGLLKVPRWALSANGKHYSLWPLVSVWANADTERWDFMREIVALGSPDAGMFEVETIIGQAWLSQSGVPFMQTHPLRQGVVRTHLVLAGEGSFTYDDGTVKSFSTGERFVVPQRCCEKIVTPRFADKHNVHLISYWSPEPVSIWKFPGLSLEAGLVV